MMEMCSFSSSGMIVSIHLMNFVLLQPLMIAIYN